MPDSIGRRMLRKLWVAPEPGPAPPVDAQIIEVDEEQLRTAVENARAGDTSAVHELSTVLMGADRTGDPSLAEFAISLLSTADPGSLEEPGRDGTTDLVGFPRLGRAGARSHR